MTNEIPAIRYLQAFEAAGRLGSFKAAAVELNVTASAISHRISSLERQLEQKLFEPQGRGLRLTEAGIGYLETTNAALRSLQMATDIVRGRAIRHRLTINVFPTFAQRWLVPRLPNLLEEYPEFQFKINATQKPWDFSSTLTDVAIVYLDQWPEGYETQLILREKIVPVCSPKLIEENDIHKPEDLAKLPLIHCTIHPDEWSQWFESQGLFTPSDTIVNDVTTRELAISAATAGLGVSLGHSPLIDDAIDNGQLVTPVGGYMDSPYSFYLITTQAKLSIPRVRKFWDWITHITSQAAS